MKSTLLVLSLALTTSAWGAGSVSGPKSLQLTVYNANYALIRDTRSVDFIKGMNAIEVEDVAARIDPTSVLFKTLTFPNSVGILEQNYQYDLISPDNIINKSVGKKVTFTSFDQNGKPYSQGGILMNPAQVFDPGQRSPDGSYFYRNPGMTSSGGLVIKTDDGKIALNPSGQITVSTMPEGLHPRPTLSWLLESDRAGAQDSEISYITDGIGWKADYVALVNDKDTALDLTGWVTLDNQSGATYRDAKLTLMAGDVRRVQPQGGYGGAYADGMRGPSGAAPQFQEKSFFEYHMYTMERPTTISDKETKQLALLSASNAPVTKEMIYDGRQEWWRNWWFPGRSGDPGGGYDTSNYHKVNVVLEVVNSEANHMGMPLPKGRIRVYKLDDTGSQQFIGEDMIDHTPRDEKVRLYIGDAFDVVGDYKRADYKKISSNVIEESFQVDLRNHKDSAVDVKVVDHVWSDWSVIQKSHDFTKKDAQTIEFPVTVPANGAVQVTYTIRTTW